MVDGPQGSKELIKDLVLKLRGDALGTAFGRSFSGFWIFWLISDWALVDFIGYFLSFKLDLKNLSIKKPQVRVGITWGYQTLQRISIDSGRAPERDPPHSIGARRL